MKKSADDIAKCQQYLYTYGCLDMYMCICPQRELPYRTIQKNVNRENIAPMVPLG